MACQEAYFVNKLRNKFCFNFLLFFVLCVVRVVDRRKAIMLYMLLRRQQKRMRRRLWVQSMNRRKRECGAYYHLVAELSLDPDRHINYFRISSEQMDHILSLIGGHLKRQTTNYRQSTEPKQ